MIQITSIPHLNPYRRQSAIADFLQCPICNQIYQPAVRLTFCPHPIISPARLFPVCTAIVVHKGGRPATGPRPPLLLEKPFWEHQENEDPYCYSMFCYYRDMGPRRLLITVARKWQAKPGRIKRNG